MGGLGNQIFQIFATISYAIKSKNQFKFLNLSTLGSGSETIRNTFWNSFFNRLKPFLINSIPQPIHVIREKDFTFNELPLNEMVNPSRDLLIFGYFQSYKYFESNYEIICRMIGLEQMKRELLKKMNYDLTFLNNVISLHFRIGDYKKLPEHYVLLSVDYYRAALNCLLETNKLTKQAHSEPSAKALYFNVSVL
jgi:hypothetical protein